MEDRIFSAPSTKSDKYYEDLVDKRFGKNDFKDAISPKAKSRGAPVVKMVDEGLSKEEIAEFDILPYANRLVVKELQISTVNGIIIAESSKEMRTNEGYVIAIGEDVDFVEVGERVYYGMYSGTWIPRLGKQETYRLINEEDLLGKVAERKTK